MYLGRTLLKQKSIFSFVAEMASGSDNALNTVPSVIIDKSGRFKYVLIKIFKGSDSKYAVRGFSWGSYHADIFEDFERTLPKGLSSDCVGGGRIEHSPNAKKIYVYGYSMGFGKADHSITVNLLKEAYSSYTDITFSDEGY